MREKLSRFPIELRPLGSRVCLAALWGAASLSAIGMAHAQELELTTGERDWLARHPVIRYGADPLWPSFKDYFELRDLVAAQDERFARGFTEALVEYALGRPFGFSDEELASTILAKAQEKELALPSFIHALIASEAFRRK